jgi:hypothetical protein
VIIEDRIREAGAERNFSPRSCPAIDVAQFSAWLTPVAVHKNSSASQFNSIERANERTRSHKTRWRKRESSQVKSPNSVIKTRSNSMKTNHGDMLKSPKNQKTRFSLPPAFQRLNSNFFGVLPPRGIPVLPPSELQIHKWSRPLLIDSAPQTEFDVTRRKQTTEKFLTGARTHIRETRFAQHSDAPPLGFPK